MAEAPGRRRGRERVEPGGAERGIEPRRVEIDLHPVGSIVQVPVENIRQLEAFTIKLIDKTGRVNTVLVKLNSDFERLHEGIVGFRGGIDEVVRAMAVSRMAHQGVNQEMVKQVEIISSVNRELQELSREFRYGTIIYRGFTEATKRYFAGVASILLLPVAFARGIAQSSSDVVKSLGELKRDLVAFDRAVVRSLIVLTALAEKGGVIGRIAGVLRILPLAYVRATRGIPRVIRRAIGRLRTPGRRLLGLWRSFVESLNEQRRANRLLAGIAGGVSSIIGFFTRLLRYIWEILVIQKLWAVAGALGGGALGRVLAGIGIGAVLASLKDKIVALASVIASGASSIGLKLGLLASKIGGAIAVVSATVALALVAGGKIAEALGVSADSIGRVAQGLRARAEEAERHGYLISSAFFRAASSIHDFAQKVWVAGDQAKEWLSTHIPVIGRALGELAQGLVHGVSTFIGGVGTIVGLIGEGVMRLQDFVTWLSGGVRELASRIQGVLADFIGWAGSGLRALWEGFLGSLRASLGWASGAIGEVLGGLTGGLGRIVDSIGRLGLEGVVGRISQVTGSLSSILSEFMSVVSRLTDSLAWRSPGGVNPREVASALRGPPTHGGVRGAGLVEGGFYGSRLIDLIVELVNEVRELRRDVSRLKPEVNVSIRTTESAYVRR